MIEYWVTGGIYKDFTFTTLEIPVKYGPFRTYKEAFDIWKANVWLNVDNALHKLTITKIKGV